MQDQVHKQFTGLLQETTIEAAIKFTETYFDFYLSSGNWDKALFHKNVLDALNEKI